MFIVTTNYDDALERAFQDEGEPYDPVTYINDDDRNRGLFRHILFDGEPSEACEDPDTAVRDAQHWVSGSN